MEHQETKPGDAGSPGGENERSGVEMQEGVPRPAEQPDYEEEADRKVFVEGQGPDPDPESKGEPRGEA
jgi:hypothetical protein